MRRFFLFSVLAVCLVLAGCNGCQERSSSSATQMSVSADTVVPAVEVPREEKLLTADDVMLAEDLLYDTYTLENTYPYEDMARSFKRDMIRNCLAYVEDMQRDSVQWVVLQDYKNMNRGAPLVCNFMHSTYCCVAGTLGVECYQSVPLYLPGDTLVPERCSRDGILARLRGTEGSFDRVFPTTLEDEWLVPHRYLKRSDNSIAFNHVVFVDRLDQNTTTLERVNKGHWKIRSMNPATTGGHAPPYTQETPLGIYLLQ